jgi:hypothetical protein
LVAIGRAGIVIDPLTVLIGKKVAALATAETLKRFKTHASFNDDKMGMERVELALDWGVELKQALALMVPFLESKFGDIDARIGELFADTQTARLYGNIGLEAEREAIDERRRMLVHAAAGILDPEIPIERKARVERRLRELEPVDVRTLFGMATLLRASEPLDPTKFLFSTGSGDVLVTSGCVRVTTSGGDGAGRGVDSTVSLTELGRDILVVLRSYVVTRGSPFVVPGREFTPGDRTDENAKAQIAELTALTELLARRRREHDPYAALYYERSRAKPASACLKFFARPRDDLTTQLVQRLRLQIADSELAITQEPQPYGTGKDGQDVEILRIEVSGPHDLLRHCADDAEAWWVWV